MANILNLKKRIKTAQNVSKTTRAMQMIAASKLKRAQEATLASRPYVEKLTSLLKNLSLKLEEESLPSYMRMPASDKTLLLILSPDKGLCGGLLSNLFREYLTLDNENPVIVTVGKKIERHIVKLGKTLVASFNFGNTLPTFDVVYPILQIVDDYFLKQEVGTVKILHTHFTSIFSQKPTISTILPITLSQEEESKITPFELFEPSVSEILPSLLKHHLEMTLYQHLLENYVSEQASRMIAMQNATENAKDIVWQLSLEYNKARQEKITNEILDISNSQPIFLYEQ